MVPVEIEVLCVPEIKSEYPPVIAGSATESRNDRCLTAGYTIYVCQYLGGILWD